MVRDAGRSEVYFAFEDGADARKLATILKAKPTGNYAGWASQRAFQLDGAMVTALAASLPAPRMRPRRALEEDSSRQHERGLSYRSSAVCGCAWSAALMSWMPSYPKSNAGPARPRHL